MPDKKPTDAEIIKALDSADLFLRDRANSKPAPLNEYDIEILLDIAKACNDAFDLINRTKAREIHYRRKVQNQREIINSLQEKINRLQVENKELQDLMVKYNGDFAKKEAEIEKLEKVEHFADKTIEALQKELKTAKAEARKEFAERLKEKADYNYFGVSAVYETDIDNLLKEMVGAEDNG